MAVLRDHLLMAFDQVRGAPPLREHAGNLQLCRRYGLRPSVRITPRWSRRLERSESEVETIRAGEKATVTDRSSLRSRPRSRAGTVMPILPRFVLGLRRLRLLSLDDISTALLDAALGATREMWVTDGLFKSCGKKQRVDVKSRAFGSGSRRSSFSCARALVVRPKPRKPRGPRLPRTAEAVEKLGWDDMKAIFATHFASEIAAVTEPRWRRAAARACCEPWITTSGSCCARRWTRWKSPPEVDQRLTSPPQHQCSCRIPADPLLME